MMGYFTNACIQGPVRSVPIPWKIAVHRSRYERTLIGVASRIGTTKLKNPVWSLNVRGADVSGKFIVVRVRFLRFGDVSE
jgi:hypothetical protein